MNSQYDCSWSHLCQVPREKTTPVLYSYNIPPMIKMSNLNITKRGTQATGMGVMIGRCSLLIANMGDPMVIQRMLAALFSGT